MSTSVVDDYSDELNDGGSHRIRRGCTIGRIINMCMTLDFFLVMITALIVSGTLGAVNLNFQYSYPDHTGEGTPVPHEVCLLYSECADRDTEPCHFYYNQTGVCKYVEVAFGFVALVALVYIIISIVRAVLTTNISFTVFIDLALIIISLLVAFTTAVAVSIGLKVTCDNVNKRYKNAGGEGNCDQLIPFLPPPADAPTPYTPTGNRYYHSVNVSQSCAWLCFAFLAVLLIITIVRVVIFFTRRKVASDQNNIEDITDVLTRENIDEDEDAKPI